jgi:hypothetical protein
MVGLATERKHLTDIIKMIAYLAESDLLALLRPHYARADQEGRALLHELFATAGEIRLGESELHITLAPPRPNRDNLPRLSPPHALRGASATAYWARLPRLAGRAQHCRGCCPGSLIGIETGHFCATLCLEV